MSFISFTVAQYINEDDHFGTMPFISLTVTQYVNEDDHFGYYAIHIPNCSSICKLGWPLWVIWHSYPSL